MFKGVGLITHALSFFKNMSIESEIIQDNLWDTLLESPIEYKAGEKIFYLYPPSLGSSLLINRHKEQVEHLEDMVYVSLAICSFENRADARKRNLLKERIEEIKQASAEELMPIYSMFVSWGQDQERFMKHFHLDVEQRYMKRAYEAKDNDTSSLTFNGKSIYGAMIDVACERYGWSMEYVVWGISLINLNMLMTDKVVSVYLSKEESRKAAIPRNRNIVKMDKNMSKEELLAILRG